MRHSLRGSVDWNKRENGSTDNKRVTPYAGVWIEIRIVIYPVLYVHCHSLRGSVDWNSYKISRKTIKFVTPYAGVWIEIVILQHARTRHKVTPYAGVWIEIIVHAPYIFFTVVTPYAGVWIEISNQYNLYLHDESLPTRECGLKSGIIWLCCRCCIVTPYAGVWIEIYIAFSSCRP